MALIDVVLAEDDVVFVDSTTAPDEDDLIALGALNADTVVFFGDGSVDLTSLLDVGALSTPNIVTTGGADIQISAGLLDLGVVAERNFIIDGDSSITLSSGALGLVSLNEILSDTNIAFTGSDDGTFTFNRTALALANVSTLNVVSMGAGDRIVIPATGNGPNALRFRSYNAETGTLRLINGNANNRVIVNIAMTPAEYAIYQANPGNYLIGGDDTFIFPGDDSGEPPYEVPCFGRGTLVATAAGAVAIEDLVVGDLVQTRDHGLQPIRWIKSRRLSAKELEAQPNLRPIRIRAGALGRNLPETDLILSPQHRILLRSSIALKMFGTEEILAAAKQLLQVEGIDIAEDMAEVEYFHMLFDQHEVVIANGAETESLFTGPEALKSVGRAALAEIVTLFPELGAEDYRPVPARLLASGRRARKLAVRHAQNSKPLVH